MNPRTFLIFLFLNAGCGTLNTAFAKDFGVHGHTFEIAEPDLLKDMEGKLKRLRADGKLEEINKTFMRHVQGSLEYPKPVEGITKAREFREFFYDPSITVSYDLKDHEGRVFHKAGTRLNPLAFQPLSAPLVFIDGEDKAQVAWVEATYLKTRLKENQRLKIILTSGSPFQLMEQWRRQLPQDNFAGAQPLQDNPVYFDQGGVLTSKLGIRHIPAVVVQAVLKLKISEIVLKDSLLEEDKP